MTYAIETLNLTKNFGKTAAVNDLSFTVNPGEIFGLVGPDGAGKTTTMRLLCGLYNRTSGLSKVLGYDTQNDSEKVKENIGYMSQKFSLYPDLTVEENLDFFSDIRLVGEEQKINRKKEMYAFSRLEPFKDRRAGNLSGGMKQKLALSCALMHTPKVLFLDEPTTGVDPVSRREFWEIIRSLVPAVTVFVSTPYMDEAEKCDRIGLIHNGRMLMTDTPANVKKTMPDSIIELECSSINEAYSEIEKKFELEMFGDRLHIVSKDPASDMEKIKNSLAAKSINVCSIKPVEPTLEDVFVWMMKGTGLGPGG